MAVFLRRVAPVALLPVVLVAAVVPLDCGSGIDELSGSGDPEAPIDRPASSSTAATSHDSIATGALSPAPGFLGIWYANQPSGDRYRYKYSGGMATFPQQHVPIAVYAEEVDRTYFVFGGRPPEANRLLHMISYYDHETGRVARPRVLLDKGTDDAHDNPTLQIDDEGYLWIFSNAHGTARPAYLHRSAEPYAIDAFEHVRTTNFSYGQPWHLDGQGLVFLHTHYRDGRRWLYVSRSTEGTQWTEPELLARAGEGHYQISTARDGLVATAFNVHPEGRGLNWRTNLYVMVSRDGGRSWTNAAGRAVPVPITEARNPALALEYRSKDRLVYLKSIALTEKGRPVVLFLTSGGYESGPENAPRTYHLARWTGSEWAVSSVTDADNNYDFATLYLEENRWRIVGATEPGPQRYNTGGEIAVWISEDRGRTWTREKILTRDSRWNHLYPRRPVDAHPGFYTLWADGHGREPSRSRLYFSTRSGVVHRLPVRMDSTSARPIPLE